MEYKEECQLAIAILDRCYSVHSPDEMDLMTEFSVFFLKFQSSVVSESFPVVILFCLSTSMSFSQHIRILKLDHQEYLN